MTHTAALKFCFKTCVAMKFDDDDDDDDDEHIRNDATVWTPIIRRQTNK